MNDKINIKELLDIKSFKSAVSVWVCRDWAGPHLFSEKPTRTNNGNPEDEWCGVPTVLENVVTVKNMVYVYTYGWDINYEPEKITINFEIEL